MRDYAYYNGRICPTEEMMIPSSDRAFYFGDGIYDVAMIFNGHCSALQDHLDRFYGNLQKVGFHLQMTKEELEKTILDFVGLLDPEVRIASLYLQSSRGSAPRKHAYGKDMIANLYMQVKEASFGEFGRQVSAITLEDRRFEMCDIKTLNLMLNCMAQQQAVDQGAYEAILHRGDRVTEGSHSGVAIIKDGVFITPPLDRFILPSVSRKHYLEICRKLQVPFEERAFTMTELKSADEVIILSTTAPGNICRVIDGDNVGGKNPQLLNRLFAAYADRLAEECGWSREDFYAGK